MCVSNHILYKALRARIWTCVCRGRIATWYFLSVLDQRLSYHGWWKIDLCATGLKDDILKGFKKRTQKDSISDTWYELCFCFVSNKKTVTFFLLLVFSPQKIYVVNWCYNPPSQMEWLWGHNCFKQSLNFKKFIVC